MIGNCLLGEKLPVYGDGQNMRDWLHVSDHCRAVDLVMRRGRAGEVYNVGGNKVSFSDDANVRGRIGGRGRGRGHP